MKGINFKPLLSVALVALAVIGCKDKDFDAYRIQSDDGHGFGQNMISTAVTAGSSVQFYANAVDPSATESEIQLIPVVLTSSGLAPHDIHVTMVEARDSLDSYNNNNGTDYTMPDPTDGGVTPAFTLVDNGVVTIKAGTTVGYLKVKLVTQDYFGGPYAFSYRIGSVKEGNPVSGNNNFGIVAIIPKNKYDGVYELNILTAGWGGYGIADSVAFGDGWGDYGPTEFVTASLTQNTLNTPGLGPLQPAFTKNLATKTGFGATGPIFTFDSNDNIINVDNTVPDDGRGRDFHLNTVPPAKAWEFKYYPTGYPAGSGPATIICDYIMVQNGRPDQTIKIKLVYSGPR